MRRTLARSAEQYVRPRCWHSVTSKAGARSEKLTYSSRALPEWLEIGKIDVNAACKPSFLRDSDAVSACRNARYDESWVSSRNGTSSTLARFAKLLRMRFFSVNEYDCAVVTSVAIDFSDSRKSPRNPTPAPRCHCARQGFSIDF